MRNVRQQLPTTNGCRYTKKAVLPGGQKVADHCIKPPLSALNEQYLLLHCCYIVIITFKEYDVIVIFLALLNRKKNA